jgi:replicative superfamily II helicase
MIKKLELLDEEIPTARPYTFIDNFNRVQSTIILNGLPTEDCNLVLGTATSTGKTISAELFIHAVLPTGKKVLYVAPMKSLVREKFDEWQGRFGRDKVAILTGDYKLTSSNRHYLTNADIIVVTSEMLDSQTRTALRTENHWLNNIGLLIMDESHIIGSGARGPAAESGITRLCVVQKDEPPRVVLLSATLPNEDDFANWLYNLNNKKTYTLNSPWRPVPLKWNFYPCKEKYYSAIRKNNINLACQLVRKYPDDKFLVFVHEKKTGHNLVAAMKKIGVYTEFHRADATMQKRIELESNFLDKNSDLRVLVSTSTLAYGNNLPARHVIILGTTRGTSPVDLADIIQMSGRAGRTGLDKVGDCHLLCQDNHTSKWSKLTQQSPSVKSALLDGRHLRFQVLAEIDLGVLQRVEELPAWFKKTLVGQQVDYPEDYFRDTLEKLVRMDMLTLKNNKLCVTDIGRVGTRYYFTPDDVYHWCTFAKDNKVIDSDTKLAGLIGGAPTLSIDYVPAEFKNTVSYYNKACRDDGTRIKMTNIFTPYALWSHLRGDANDKPNLRFYINNITNDIERIETALRALSKHIDLTLPEDMTVRIKHGVPKQLAFLVNIPGIGPKKAWLMYTAGMTDWEKLTKADRSTFVTCLGPKTADKVIQYVKEKYNR